MEKQDFVIFTNSILYSNCCVYHSPNKGRVHLIPVIHLGTADYYRNLLKYIGDSPCVYENIDISPSNEAPQVIYSSFEEQVEALEPEVDKFWAKYSVSIERFYKKYLDRYTKKGRKRVNKLVSHTDEKVQKIFSLSEKSFYGIQNIFLSQLYWAELTDLCHQYTIIDYINDIRFRDNWIHADLNVSKQLEEQGVDAVDLLELIITKPTPELLEIRVSEIRLLLLIIKASIEMFELQTIKKRRENLALSIVKNVVDNYKAFEELSPEYLIQGRNNLVENAITGLFGEGKEIFVFFGAAHQIGIERFLLSEDFTFESQKQFEVFSINGVNREY